MGQVAILKYAKLSITEDDINAAKETLTANGITLVTLPYDINRGAEPKFEIVPESKSRE